MRTRRRSLQEKRNAAVDLAVEAALSGQQEGIDRHLNEVATYDRLLAATPPSRWREGLVAATVGIVCVTAIGLAWTLRIPETRVTMTLAVTGMEMALSAPWQWSGGMAVVPRPLQLAEFSFLEVPSPSSVSTRLSNGAWMDVSGGGATLNAVEAGNGARLALEVGDDGSLQIFAQDAPFAGAMTLQGPATLSAGNHDPDNRFEHALSPTFPETVTFRADGDVAVPARLHVLPAAPLVLNNLLVDGLAFSREVPDQPGTVVFVSTISDGQVVLTDVGRTVDLNAGDQLSMEGLSGQILEVRFDEQLQVQFRGRADSIRVGSTGFDQDLSPTLIDYLYHNQKIPLIWSALAFLWGILWSTRKFLFA